MSCSLAVAAGDSMRPVISMSASLAAVGQIDPPGLDLIAAAAKDPDAKVRRMARVAMECVAPADPPQEPVSQTRAASRPGESR